MPPIWTPTVRTIADGLPVAASTDNGPISDLTNRTDWLKAQLAALDAGTQLVLREQTAESGLIPGTPVYLDKVTNTFKAAKVSIDGTTLLAGASTFWQGMILTISGTTADILLFGQMSLTTLAWAPVFDNGIFADGEIYLSGTTAGKITTNPTTSAIYLGQMRSSGEFILRATDPNAFLDHVHYQRELVGDPAGTVVDPAFGAAQTISAPNATLQGWLPANATYFPGYVTGVQIPTGAVFGYNIQQTSESALRQIFPMLPSNNAQFSQDGVILSQDKIVVNEYGIWWMTNTYGNVPWPVDYAATSIASPITVWTTRIVASQTVLELLLNVLLTELEDGGIDTVAVRAIKSGAPDDLEVTGTTGNATDGWQGLVTITNKGVTGLRTGRGLALTATGGNAVNGWKGLIDLRTDLELPAAHLWTQLTAVGDKLALLTTNGVTFGSTIGARGHRLGSNAADFIDWLICAGNDLPAGVDHQVVLTIKACVDTVVGAPTPGDILVETYRWPVGAPVGTTTLVRQDDLSFLEGVPGQVQAVTLGPVVNLVVQAGDQLLVRIKNSTGGNPLAVDTFRQLSTTYQLIPV